MAGLHYAATQADPSAIFRIVKVSHHVQYYGS